MRKVIGLTGGIATGKSAVTSILRDLGYVVIDADAVVHELQAPDGQLYQAILSEFGPEFFNSDDNNGKQLNRKKLAELVFTDGQAYQKLSNLQDQIIRQELEARRVAELAKSDKTFFMDIPLLLEEGYEPLFDEIWLVVAAEDIQLKRLMSRSNLSEDEARARIAHQMPLSEKVKKVDVILENSGSLDDLKEQVLRNLIHDFMV